MPAEKGCLALFSLLKKGGNELKVGKIPLPGTSLNFSKCSPGKCFSNLNVLVNLLEALLA